MLSKVSNDVITIEDTATYNFSISEAIGYDTNSTTEYFRYSNNTAYSESKRVKLFTAPSPWIYTINLYLNKVTGTTSLWIWPNVNNFLAIIPSLDSTTKALYTATIYVKKWGTVIYGYPTAYRTNDNCRLMVYKEGDYYTVERKLPKKSDIIWYPKNLKVENIWKRIDRVFLWQYAEWKYKTEMVEKDINFTDTVTTGSITLWNAVGFVEMEIDGALVKIPYYR